jgi:hypothetical protein
MNGGHPKCRQHQAQGISGWRMSVYNQNTLFGQCLLQNQQHIFVVERVHALCLAQVDLRNLLENVGQGKI